jgi:hypothetical protein
VSTADAGLLKRLHEVVSKREMPPEDEPQPNEDSRQGFLASVSKLLATMGSEATNKALEPGWGNLVNHKALFTEPKVRQAATPAGELQSP